MLSDRKHPCLLRTFSWFVMLAFLGPIDCFLVLVYFPSLADSLESWVIDASVRPPELRTELPGDVDVEAPGIDQPPTFSADKAALDDDAPVVGVYVSGHARAYALEAFQHRPDFHIVNDLLGDVPISITHCDISGCTRVFTAKTPGRTLTLSVGGRKNRGLLLKHNGQLFFQDTGAPLVGNARFPYREYPAEVTEWGVWRKAHPQTDVYLGAGAEGMPAAAAENAPQAETALTASSE
jgi:hypothetical protein